MEDPVCGMKVDENSEFSSDYGGRVYYFCSADCKKKFDLNPVKYTR